MPENHIVIIIDGKGFKKGSVEWLRKVVEHKKYTNPINENKIIEVFSLTEFITWANKFLR